MMPFVKSHPLLTQKVVTRSAPAAVSKIGAFSNLTNKILAHAINMMELDQYNYSTVCTPVKALQV